MKSVILAGVVLSLSSQLALALPCDGFQLTVKNNLVDNLLATAIKLDNAEVAPGYFQKLDSKTEQTFTVNNSSETIMNGKFSFHTISLPSHNVKIRYTLENKGPICEFTPVNLDGDYAIDTSRQVGQVVFTVNPK